VVCARQLPHLCADWVQRRQGEADSRNPNVMIEPCNSQGTALGEHRSGVARICEPVEYERINALLNTKYGVMKRFIDVMTRLRGGSSTYDVIEITGAP
jgi:hypothetical protein